MNKFRFPRGFCLIAMLGLSIACATAQASAAKTLGKDKVLAKHFNYQLSQLSKYKKDNQYSVGLAITNPSLYSITTNEIMFNQQTKTNELLKSIVINQKKIISLLERTTG